MTCALRDCLPFSWSLAMIGITLRTSFVANIRNVTPRSANITRMSLPVEFPVGLGRFSTETPSNLTLKLFKCQKKKEIKRVYHWYCKITVGRNSSLIKTLIGWVISTYFVNDFSAGFLGRICHTLDIWPIPGYTYPDIWARRHHWSPGPVRWW